MAWYGWIAIGIFAICVMLVLYAAVVAAGKYDDR